ncbi:prenyltransferase/squalene oxidase repeat-containing protein [Streptomyces graminofaciens]|uniref:prenyltransferase/squalene oxidase repeat-containing protein n=1 Tax=Streptomyces graminofaciens TaxID=68212 RepID=UPI002574309F|nr:prenyltransferase/squalene oxidase repeat-containing protein [Streptomyces graminofaciens]
MTATAALTVLLGLGSVPVALADGSPAPSASPSQAIPTGLYGSDDPAEDGVRRQSLTLLALSTAGEKPPAEAVRWLVDQQCDNGAWAAYRADPYAKCDATTPVDPGSTAVAVQALAWLGRHDTEIERAVDWLKDVQHEDGGWGDDAGGASDAGSTSAVIGALAAVGADPADQKRHGNSPYDLLGTLSVPCQEKGAGAFAQRPDKKGGLVPDAEATAAGVLGSLGKGYVVGAWMAGDKADGCRSDSGGREAVAHNGVRRLTEATAENGCLTSALSGSGGRPDHGATADAVVALAAAGATDATSKPLAWLKKNHGSWAAEAGPAAYARLILAAHATWTDPHDFGGTDLVEQLAATGPATDVDYFPTPDGNTSAGEEGQAEDDSGFGWSGKWLLARLGVFAAISLFVFFVWDRKRDRS